MKTFVRSALKEVAMPRMFHRFVVGTIVLGFVLVTAPAPARASVSSGKSASFAAKVESWLAALWPWPAANVGRSAEHEKRAIPHSGPVRGPRRVSGARIPLSGRARGSSTGPQVLCTGGGTDPNGHCT